MAIKQMFLKGLDDRDLIVFLSGPGIEFSDEDAYKIHKTMSPSDNMIFFTYDHLLKSSLFSNFIPNKWVEAFTRSIYYKDIENTVKDFFISKAVRDAIVTELRENINGNCSPEGLNPRSVTFLAHGIGSVVVVDYLNKYKPDITQVSMIFIGSPLYLPFPWHLSKKPAPIYKNITNVFSGTKDSVCAHGKIKRHLGAERAVKDLTHNPFHYIKYISHVNDVLSNLWNREEDQ